MKLYIISKLGNGKIYLDTTASTRSELASKLGRSVFSLGNEGKIHVDDVIAECDSTLNAGMGAAIGGGIGMLLGPIGILIGAGIGGVFGNDTTNAEKIRVEKFNRSKV